LRCLFERSLGFGELVEASVGNTPDRKYLDLRILIVWLSWMGIKQAQHIRIHSPPQERLRFQSSEFPLPFGAPPQQALAFSMRFVLTLL